jgi:hypothetical protein
MHFFMFTAQNENDTSGHFGGILLFFPVFFCFCKRQGRRAVRGAQLEMPSSD